MALSKIDGTNFIEGTVPSTVAPGAGKILQVVSAINIATLSTTSTSFVDVTNVTASITPISTSNKIMIIYSGDGLYGLVSGVNVSYRHQILKDSTVLTERVIAAGSGSGGLQSRCPMSITVLDSPNTTSAVTYKAQHKVSNSSSTGTVRFANIVLMEVSA